MDACLGCLGLRRVFQGASGEACGSREHPETSRLLYDDPYRSQYGTNDPNLQRVIQQQPDPDLLRREREEMEQICHEMSTEVVDVFGVAPQEGNRPLTRDQAKALLTRNGINVSDMTEAQLASYARQPSSAQQKAMQSVHDGDVDQRPLNSEDAGPLVTEGRAVEIVQTGNLRRNWSPTAEELIYKTIKRSRRDPTSIELHPSENKAAKAVLG